MVYRAGTKYSVSVFGMFDGGESMPLAGEEKTTLMDAPDPPAYVPSGKMSQYFVSNPPFYNSEKNYIMKGIRGKTCWMLTLTAARTTEMVLVRLLLRLSSPLRQCLQFVLSLGSFRHTRGKFTLKPMPHKSRRVSLNAFPQS